MTTDPWHAVLGGSAPRYSIVAYQNGVTMASARLDPPVYREGSFGFEGESWRLCASCRDEYSNAHEMVDLQNITKMCVVCKVRRWGTYGVPNKEKNGKPSLLHAVQRCKDLACHVALLSLHHHGINMCTTAISHTLDSFRYYSSCR